MRAPAPLAPEPPLPSFASPQSAPRPGWSELPDVIFSELSADHRPPISRRLAAACLACVVVAVALVWGAVHVHGELGRTRAALARARAVRPIRFPTQPPPVPQLGAPTRQLLTDGRLHVQVTVLAAANPASGYARVLVTGRVTGGRPDTRYRLVGITCPYYAEATAWATGRTGRSGVATLSGRPFTTTLNAFLALVLSPRGGRFAPPGLQGHFGAGDVVAFPAGYEPCIPVEPPYAPPTGS